MCVLLECRAEGCQASRGEQLKEPYVVRLETTAQMVSLLTVHSTDLLGQKTRQPFLQSCLRARQWSTG